MLKRKYIMIFFFSLLLAFSIFNIDKRDVLVIHGEEVASTIDISLEEKMNGILQDNRLHGAITAISVRQANTGEEIYVNQEDTRLHPASNMKILTAITALEILGPDHQFSTSIYTDGKIVGDELQGNVYIKGQGDPTLRIEDLDHFAMGLKEQGIREIKGKIIGDDTWYDDVRLSQDLNWSDEPFHTGAQVSALTLSPNEDYDAGTVLIEVLPGKQVGEPAQISVTPKTDYVNLTNQIKTVEKGQNRKLTIDREHGSNQITIEGTIPIDAGSKKLWAAVWEPTSYVLDVFTTSLKNHGITVAKNAIETGKVPSDATLIVKKDSMPLNELLLPFMKLSNNGHAEILVKEMGKFVHDEGSWEKGIDVMEEALGKMGVDLNAVQIRDGSGMSHKNFVTASELTKLLYLVQEKEWYTHFLHSLPVAGEPDRLVGGTLRHRMKEEGIKGRIQAKTGSITGVNTLSGYVTTAQGEQVIFSILLNNYIEESVTDLLDKIVEIIATHN